MKRPVVARGKFVWDYTQPFPGRNGNGRAGSDAARGPYPFQGAWCIVEFQSVGRRRADLVFIVRGGLYARAHQARSGRLPEPRRSSQSVFQGYAIKTQAKYWQEELHMAGSRERIVQGTSRG